MATQRYQTNKQSTYIMKIRFPFAAFTFPVLCISSLYGSQYKGGNQDFWKTELKLKIHQMLILKFTIALKLFFNIE